jgi:NAD-dependent SIR2 family protein deacetylase
LIQAQYDAAIQNPPWEKKDEYDIDDRPKKKRRVTERWTYEIVYPEGMGPEDFRSVDGSPKSPRSQSGSENDSGFCASQRENPQESRESSMGPLQGRRTNDEESPAKSLATPPPTAQSIAEFSHLEISTNDTVAIEDTTVSQPLSDTYLDVASKPSDPSSSSPLSSLPSSPFASLENDQTIEVDESNPTPSQTSQSSQSSDCDETSTPDSSQPSGRTLPNLKGRDLFDSIIWADAFTTSIFYMFITSFRQRVLQDVQSTSPTHQFIKSLKDAGRLLRNYTQNIDGLEEREGLSTDLSLGPGGKGRQTKGQKADPNTGDKPKRGVDVVQLHGSLGSLRCGICAKLSVWEDADREQTTLSGQAPDCPFCLQAHANRTGRGRRGLAVGRLRPDVVLYGEEHPNANLIGPVVTHDLAVGPDVLLIMGTSLKVHGLKIMVREFSKAVHSKGGKVVFVNRTKPSESVWGDVIDYWVEWDCDEWVVDLKERRSDIWSPPGSSQQKESNSRRESGGRKQVSSEPKLPRKQAPRPQATRDDRMSGAFHTFKILDHLGVLTDDEGRRSSRAKYWPEYKPSRASTGSITKAQATNKPAKAPARKSENSKKRKSYPSAAQEKRDQDTAAFIARKWEFLRNLAPGLAEKVPDEVMKSNRFPFSEIKANFPEYLKPFCFEPTPNKFVKNTHSHIPNLKGLSLPVEMNLITHPPSGAALPLHRPSTTNPITTKPNKPKPRHSYGTRAAHRFSSDDTIVVSTEDVPEPEISCVESKEEPVDGPSTPHRAERSEQRIKRMGSIGTILSSSPEEVYHDAVEEL